jgi:hypothetical protein
MSSFFERDSALSHIIVCIDSRERDWSREIYQMNIRAENAKLTNPLLTSQFAPSGNSPEFGPVFPLPLPSEADNSDIVAQVAPIAMISNAPAAAAAAPRKADIFLSLTNAQLVKTTTCKVPKYFTSVELPVQYIPKPNGHTSSIGILICGLLIIWLRMRK